MSKDKKAGEPVATKDWPVVKEAARIASAQLGYYHKMMGAAPPAAARMPLTEQQMYEVEDRARVAFRSSQSAPRGQQINYWDSLTPWLIREVERAHGIGAAGQEGANHA